MHIGLIGGIGPAATEFYYRGLIDRHARSDTALDLTIVHADVREMSRNLATRNARRRAEVFAPLLRRLAAEAVARGCGRMEWSVLDWNALAQGVYRRLGGVSLGEIRSTGPDGRLGDERSGYRRVRPECRRNRDGTLLRHGVRLCA